HFRAGGIGAEVAVPAGGLGRGVGAAEGDLHVVDVLLVTRADDVPVDLVFPGRTGPGIHHAADGEGDRVRVGAGDLHVLIADVDAQAVVVGLHPDVVGRGGAGGVDVGVFQHAVVVGVAFDALAGEVGEVDPVALLGAELELQVDLDVDGAVAVRGRVDPIVVEPLLLAQGEGGGDRHDDRSEERRVG